MFAYRVHTMQPSTGDYAASSMGSRGTGPEVRISYDAARGSYRLEDATRAISFREDDLTLTDGYLQSFKRTSAPFVTDTFTIFGNSDLKQPLANDAPKLTYLSYGIWSNTNGTLEQTKTYYLLFGFPTGEDMPASGTASYSGVATGHYIDVREDWEGSLGGTASLTADFGAGTVTTDLTLTTTSGVFGQYYGEATFGEYAFNGQILTGSGDFRSGFFTGGFYGPGAAEMGYTFWFRAYPDPADPYQGASLRRSEYWVLGAVVGTKD